jgi:hypothetical protein
VLQFPYVAGLSAVFHDREGFLVSLDYKVFAIMKLANPDSESLFLAGAIGSSITRDASALSASEVGREDEAAATRKRRAPTRRQR